MKRPLYARIASAIVALRHAHVQNNDDNILHWMSRLEKFEDQLPRGAGFDRGTSINFEKSDASKLVLRTAFHHMDGVGHYVGWTEHIVTVKASLAFGIKIDVDGADHNGILEYIGESFHHDLTLEGE